MFPTFSLPFFIYKPNWSNYLIFSNQNIENLHIGEVLSVEFGPAEKKISGHFLGQYWTLNLN